jgi:hypothetical protein
MQRHPHLALGALTPIGPCVTETAARIIALSSSSLAGIALRHVSIRISRSIRYSEWQTITLT